MKRFTETTKWTDPWFRKLRPSSKLLWFFLCEQCDCAGVIDLDLELASFMVGEPITQDDVDAIGTRLADLPNGKTRIVKFIEFQYGVLSESCPAHKPVLRALSAHGITPTGCDANTLCNRVSDRVSNTLQDKDKEEEKDNTGDKGCGEKGGEKTNQPDPKPAKQTACPIRFAADDGFTGVPEILKRQWESAYPAVDIQRALADAAAWVISNPTKVKKNWARFLSGWLSRCQDRGGNKSEWRFQQSPKPGYGQNAELLPASQRGKV